jgi:hypothetical protein
VFAALGVDLDAVRASRRPVLRFCVDWTEQRHHLAGSLGAAVLGAFESAGWVRRQPGRRSLDVSAAGAAQLSAALGVRVPRS